MSVASVSGTKAPGKALFVVKAQIGDGSASNVIVVTGREAWLLDRLVVAGAGGVSSHENVGVRVAAYAHDLRKNFGLSIETVREGHDGLFSGSHGRYILHTPIRILERRVHQGRRLPSSEVGGGAAHG